MKNTIVAVIFIFVIVGFIWLIAHTLKNDIDNNEVCARAGGIWYHPYKSEGICLQESAVIELGGKK